MLRISVIIPTRNRPKEIVKCLSSLSGQTILPNEIIIVDASNSNETEKIIKQSFSSQLPLTYIHSLANLPLQRNKGVDESNGDIIFFFDDDVILDNNYVEEILEIFKKDTRRVIGGVMGNIVNIQRLKSWHWKRILRTMFFLDDFGYGKFKISGMATWPFGLNKVSQTEFLSGCLSAFRKEVFTYFRFDENFTFPIWDDVDFSFRVSRKYHNIYTPFAKCIHEGLSCQAEKPIEWLRQFEKFYVYFFNKNLPKSLIHYTVFVLALTTTKANRIFKKFLKTVHFIK